MAAEAKNAKAGAFGAMNLEKDLVSGLNRMGYTAPTPVQRKALPIALAGMDMVCMARTGSGKTCVFLLPMIQRVKNHDSVAGVRAVVLSPTRELAVQTFRFAKDMAKFTDIRIISIVGGDPIEAQFEALASRPDIIIATPGRLMHHIREIPTFKLSSCRYLVFDEADRLFEMGFAEQLNEIVRECPEERQTLLFSATMPKQLIQFSRAGLKDPQLVRLETDAKMSDELRIANLCVRSNEKMAALLYLVRTIIPADQMTIVFTATRHHSEFVHALFNRIGVTSTLVYGTMDQDARSANLKAFRQGQVSYLIVTDLAARGIDVPLLNNVINLHFPPSPKLFVHRCGRAARQGRVGFALSLVEPEEMAFLADVHTFLGKPITTADDIRAAAGSGSGSGVDGEAAGLGAGLGADGSAAPVAYTLASMQPAWVHTGLLPQDVLDEENDFLKRALADDDNLQTLARIGDNGMKQYRRTRSEASREGVQLAKRLAKANSVRAIHPLIAGCDPGRCTRAVTDKQAFVRMLQTFRPAQTVFESGIGLGTGSQVIKGKRKAGTAEAHGVEVMRMLRKSMAPALERARRPAATAAGSAGAEDGGEGGEGEGGGDEGRVALASWEQLEAQAAQGGGWGEGWDELGGGGGGGDDEDDDDDGEDEGKAGGKGKGKAGRKASARPQSAPTHASASASASASAAASLPSSSHSLSHSHSLSLSQDEADADSQGQGRLRLSAAERKKLKRAGLSQAEIGETAQRRAAQAQLIAASTSGGSGLRSHAHAHAHADSDAANSGAGAGAGSSTGPGSGFGLGLPSGRFMDPRFYMTYGTEDEARVFHEASMQPMSGLKTAEALQAQAMETAMLDVAPDDAVELNKKRRINRWDAKKRKFVKQSIEEISQLKDTKKRSRAEASGAGQGSTSKIPQGEMYSKWKKRTRREVSAPGQGDAADDRPGSAGAGPGPNVKVNRHLKDEVKGLDALRRARKDKDNVKLKNMSKDKRRQIEGKRKKGKAAGEKATSMRGATKAGRKKIKAILRY